MNDLIFHHRSTSLRAPGRKISASGSCYVAEPHDGPGKLLNGSSASSWLLCVLPNFQLSKSFTLSGFAGFPSSCKDCHSVNIVNAVAQFCQGAISQEPSSCTRKTCTPLTSAPAWFHKSPVHPSTIFAWFIAQLQLLKLYQNLQKSPTSIHAYNGN